MTVTSHAASVPQVWSTLELSAAAFALWTLIYHAWLLTGWSAESARWLFLCALALGALVLLLHRRARRQERLSTGWSRTGAMGWLLAVGVGSTTLFLSRPDRDDLIFFHRALVQVNQLDSPFFFGDVSHNFPGLPAGYFFQATTSYEYLVALLAQSVGMDPLWAYQNLACALAAALVPLAYMAIAETMGLRRWEVVALAAAAVLFLFIDGSPHRSFGNFAFVRLWQGKCILVTLLLPMALGFARRFLQQPTPRNLLSLASLSICALGLSGSGVLLIPVFLFAITCAALLTRGCSRANLWRAVQINGAGFYCSAAALCIVAGLTPMPEDKAVWKGFPAEMWQNLDLVCGGPEAAVRNAMILILLPLVSLPRRLALFLVSLTAVLCAVFVNPWSGPVVMRIVHPGVFWRLAYLFPLPLCAGLLVVGWSRYGWLTREGLRKLGVSLAVLVACGVAYERSTFSPPVRLKRPSEYKLRENVMRFGCSVRRHLESRNVLAPEAMTMVALLEPSLRFETTRSVPHLFRNIGRPEEIPRRVDAQRLVEGDRDVASVRAFRASVELGVDAVIAWEHSAEIVEQVLESSLGEWEKAHVGEGLVLFLRQ